MEREEDILLETRQDLIQYLKDTKYEHVVLKFYADWCAPCKSLSPTLHEMVNKKATHFQGEKKKFIFIEVDVDECFDLYAFLKSKKMVRGIPTLFLYKKEIYMKSDESHLYIPQGSISGTNIKDIQHVLDLIQ